MMAGPHPDMLAAALAAWDAGLCVVRARADGTKRPDGDWKRWQAERPSREQVAEWFRDGHPAMGAICGAVSGDLEMLELEGRFVAEIGTADFARRMREAGLEFLLRRLTDGYLVVSPSGGRHFPYRVEGGVGGNTKLASRDATPAELDADPAGRIKVLIETRGEGGFIMLAPSHGSAHPTGRPWAATRGGFASLPTITAAERDALHAVARSYHSATERTVGAPPPSAPTPVAAYRGGDPGGSWVDAVAAHLSATTTMRELLERHGWTWEYTDRHGREMMRRPGKDTDGISASVNANGRLLVFSTSTPFPGYHGQPLPPTHDLLDVVAVYEHGGDRMAAARHIADQTGIMDAYRRARDAETAARLLVDEPPPTTGDGRRIDAETGEILDDDPDEHVDDPLWGEREVLAHVLAAARSRLVSPFAVLGAVLARVAAFTPPNTCLPALIGGRVPLSLYVALHGTSGAGKSSPAACAADLLPHTPPGCVGPLALGSGEGLVEAYHAMAEEVDGDGKKRNVKRQVHRGALFTLDEGQLLSEVAKRKGATILPVLRTAWTGGDPGQANASVETRRTLRPGSYAVGLISLWQDDSGAELLADADGGTPQRFVWLPTVDRGATLDHPEWPGGLDWTPPALIAVGGIVQPHPLELHPSIVHEVRSHHVAKLRGEIVTDPLDSHRALCRLKLAGVLAVLDGRHDINLDDWRIAGRIMDISDSTRAWIVAEAARRSAAKAVADVRRAAAREEIMETAAADRALMAGAKAAWRCAERAGRPVSRREITLAMTSRTRQAVGVDDVIAEAVRRGWIRPVGVTSVAPGWVPGEAKPA